MSARAVRLIVITVCVAGVAGMIVTTVLKHSGAALTLGIISAIAILCLIVATAVSGGPRLPDTEAQAAQVEDDVLGLIAQGADERTVRSLVRDAVRLGRALASEPPAPP